MKFFSRQKWSTFELSSRALMVASMTSLYALSGACITRTIVVREPVAQNLNRADLPPEGVVDQMGPTNALDGKNLDDVDYFVERMSPYGTWVVHSELGRVFVPNNRYRGSSWRPFSNGYWANSAFGLSWYSNLPFGYYTSHYGRWAYDIAYGGWFWCPGTVWSSAWVSWQMGQSYLGWAALSPAGFGVYMPNRWVFSQRQALRRGVRRYTTSGRQYDRWARISEERARRRGRIAQGRRTRSIQSSRFRSANRLGNVDRLEHARRPAHLNRLRNSNLGMRMHLRQPAVSRIDSRAGRRHGSDEVNRAHSSRFNTSNLSPSSRVRHQTRRNTFENNLRRRPISPLKPTQLRSPSNRRIQIPSVRSSVRLSVPQKLRAPRQLSSRDRARARARIKTPSSKRIRSSQTKFRTRQGTSFRSRSRSKMRSRSYGRSRSSFSRRSRR